VTLALGVYAFVIVAITAKSRVTIECIGLFEVVAAEATG
jgi:hypothetical protein